MTTTLLKWTKDRPTPPILVSSTRKKVSGYPSTAQDIHRINSEKRLEERRGNKAMKRPKEMPFSTRQMGDVGDSPKGG